MPGKNKAFKHLPFPNDILLTKQLTCWSCGCVCLFKITKALSASKFDTSSSVWAEAVNWVCLFWQTQRWLNMYPWERGFLGEVFLFLFFCFSKTMNSENGKEKPILSCTFHLQTCFWTTNMYSCDLSKVASCHFKCVYVFSIFCFYYHF